jgi:hypothetical protein
MRKDGNDKLVGLQFHPTSSGKGLKAHLYRMKLHIGIIASTRG